MASRGTEQSIGIFEIYLSVQGESTHAGRPCVFVRTAGCGLRCSWCDTPHAYEGSRPMQVADILDAVNAFGVSLVELTGGEPMEQRGIHSLMHAFIDSGYELLLETGGHMSLEHVPAPVIKVVDFKAPGSGMQKRNFWPNLAWIGPRDEIKLVLRDRDDYEWARTEIQKRRLSEICTVLLSPVFETLEPEKLVRWLLEDRLNVRLNLQQHKYIWDKDKTGV